ncbi:helix-hairpin-helix domain-containing protein [Luteimonas aestuarii]|uniref:Helix-hairpin-helix domain-containing protein n=1 Tax=Luteimonas aestuarii TaxID=453837 RepID=A0A4R5U1H9_9GAMM|nr:ComEA family DNA-binding protein [Luteimonas aestuarii]TDK27455.1 helix-hairpin-helix domain-containing protein [Luteimonas aestuarii]
MHKFRTLFATLLFALLFAGSAVATEKVDINTADAATLARVLVNVGPAKAEAIVEYRQANGPFRSAEQLAQVSGIGLKTVEKNHDRIVVGAAPARSNTPAAAQASARNAPQR